MFLEIAEGKVSGERLNGTLLSGGGDWITLGSDGWGQIDVRGQMVTDDGAYIYAHYTGLLELNDKVMNATASGTATDCCRPRSLHMSRRRSVRMGRPGSVMTVVLGLS
jgi:hypothetical protein